MGLRSLFHRPAVEAGSGTRASPENDGQEESDQGEEKHPISLSIAGTDRCRLAAAVRLREVNGEQKGWTHRSDSTRDPTMSTE